jgi:hypothetical protein
MVCHVVLHRVVSLVNTPPDMVEQLLKLKKGVLLQRKGSQNIKYKNKRSRTCNLKEITIDHSSLYMIVEIKVGL